MCGWYNIRDWFAVAFKLVFVWNGLLFVLLNDYVYAKLSGAKGGLDSVRKIAVVVFGINVWSIFLIGCIATVWSVWIKLKFAVNGICIGIIL